MRPRDSIYLNGADALKQNCRKTVMTTVKAADRQAPPVSINPRSSLFRTLFRKYGNVFSAQVAQAGGLRFGRLSACPTLVRPLAPARRSLCGAPGTTDPVGSCTVPRMREVVP